MCAPSSSRTELAINNVRAMLLGGGDMWWDLSSSVYQVPKDPIHGQSQPTSAIFAGGLWVGGYDPAGSLKIAAIQYRNFTTNEWWPGPINEVDPTMAMEICDDWDRHFTVFGDEIREHIAKYNKAQEDPSFEYSVDDIPESIKYWPAIGNRHFVDKYGFDLPDSRQGLAPFFEPSISDNNIYEPELGEYPILGRNQCEGQQFADQMVFWIFNDIGNVHTNTDGDPMLMEVQAMAYAYTSDDEVDEMTFYKYKLINRAYQRLDSMYVSLWVDPDLGCYMDDYVGCDSSRNLMYVYNADEVDGEDLTCECRGTATYCDEIPILGIDLIQGPVVPKVFDPQTGQLRTPKRSELWADTVLEAGMSSFTYYINGPLIDAPPQKVAPSVAPQYYNYMTASWNDGSPFTYGGTGYNPNSTHITKFAFPDPPSQIGGWSMCEEQINPNSNNGYLINTGAMRMDPGAINELTYGVYWLPDQAYPCPDLSELFAAQNKVHNRFRDCFEEPYRPFAPDLEILELDQELVLIIKNEIFNGLEDVEDYAAHLIEHPDPNNDEKYVFEGYRIFQVRDTSVKLQDLQDPNKAREIATIDLQNEVTQIYNWSAISDPTHPAHDIYVPVEMVKGTDSGIRYTVQVTSDAFSQNQGDSLINHSEYYFVVVSYGYNNFETFDEDRPLSTQDQPYIESLLNYGDSENGGQPYRGTPQPFYYKDLGASFGQSVPITRLDGVGTGKNFLRITEETEQAILDQTFDGTILYENESGPFDIQIYNPLLVEDVSFDLRFYDRQMADSVLGDTVRWIMWSSKGDTIESKGPLAECREQLVEDYGFSINIGQADEVGLGPKPNWGFIGLELSYDDSSGSKWLQTAYEGQTIYGEYQGVKRDMTFNFLDDRGNFEEIQELEIWEGNHVYPFALYSYVECPTSVSPLWEGVFSAIVPALEDYVDMNNIDIVLTSDTSHWSRCVVIDATHSLALQKGFPGIGEAQNFELRQSPSVGKKDINGDGLADGDGDGMGMSWFPGYAIDVETGKRLNIFFAENSSYGQKLVDSMNASFLNGQLNATDMMFNPSSQLFIDELLLDDPVWAAYIGGQHYVYVMSTEYDSCAHFRATLEGGRSLRIARELSKVTWGMIPYMTEGMTLNSLSDGLIPNDTRISVRVQNPYQWEYGTGSHQGYNHYQFGFEDLGPEPLKKKERKEALKEAQVVPNPFYGFSAYGLSSTDNVVKITNLPHHARVAIYSLSGELVREWNRDQMDQIPNPNAGSALPFRESRRELLWDLKAASGKTVSAGTYLIHIQDRDTGEERVLKWFGVMGKQSRS